MSLFYTTGYRHQTSREISVQTPIKPDREIETFFLCLDVTGLLTLKRGFAWDSASGPTFPSKKGRGPSAVHDAFYKLFRMGLLDPKVWRSVADELFYRQLRENGMNRFRARMWYKAVRKLAGGAAKKPRKVFSVPLPGGM
jgi:hypothetical protein